MVQLSKELLQDPGLPTVVQSPELLTPLVNLEQAEPMVPLGRLRVLWSLKECSVLTVLEVLMLLAARTRLAQLRDFESRQAPMRLKVSSV